MAWRDSAPCNPSMQASKPACRRLNPHTGGQGWPWTSNSPISVLGLQLLTAIFSLCWDQNQSFMHFGHVRFPVQNCSYFKTKKIKNHPQVLTMCWSSKMCGSSVPFGHCPLYVSTLLRHAQLSLAPAASLCLPVHCPLLPYSCSCDAHMASDLGLESWQLFSQGFTAADEYVSCSFTTSKNGKSHRPYP